MLHSLTNFRYACCKTLKGERGCTKLRACCPMPIPYVDGDDTKTGCQERFVCCKGDVRYTTQGCELIYPCCKVNKDGRGCLERCRKCERKWGTPADGCEVKNHNINVITDPLTERASVSSIDLASFDLCSN